MPWTPLTFEVITPLFNNGPDGRCDAVRVPSLRGALRYWLRAVAGRYLGNELDALAALEAGVFGDTSTPSPIRMRLGARPQVITKKRTPSWTEPLRRNSDNWITYLLGPGLYQVKTSKKEAGLLRGYVPGLERTTAPRTFTIEVSFSGDDNQDTWFLCALWALTTYGGLGARTRRGFGAIRLSEVGGELPAGWTPADLAHPDLSGWKSILATGLPTHIDGRVRRALAVPADAPPSSALGTYPQLNPTNFDGALLDITATDWAGALDRAGERWRLFRATEDVPPASVSYRPPRKTWEWLNTIHGSSRDFPIGATGLPIVFKEGHEVVAQVDREAGRRPSPIWFKPVGTGSQWRIASFVFRHEFLPADVGVHQRREKQILPERLTVTTDDVAAAARAWFTNAPRPHPGRTASG